MKSILIIGLGRFGKYTARKLYEQGHDVLGVDIRKEAVENALSFLTGGQIGDSTDPDFLQALGVRNFDLCFVSIGDDFKSSLVTTTLLKELGVRHVTAVAVEDVHEYLLKRVGADEVLYPQKQLAEWAAVRFGSDHVTDYFRLDERYAVYEVEIPGRWAGKSILDLDVRRRYGISIIGIKQKGRTEVIIHPDLVLNKSMRLLVIGDEDGIRKCFKNK